MSSLGPGAKSLERGSTFKAERKPLPRVSARASTTPRDAAPGSSPTRPRLKRSRRRLTSEQRDAAAVFKASVQGRPCVVCGRSWPEMDAHHAIEASVLRDRHPAFVYDERNACPICPRFEPCHGDHTSRMRPIPRASLPESVEVFAAELDLGWLLDRIYGLRRANEV